MSDSNAYKVAAMNSGTAPPKVQEAYEDVKARYGNWLRTEEALWWQVCQRLGVTGLTPPGVSKSGSGGKPSKTIELRDLEFCEDRDFVNAEGMIVGVKFNPPVDDRLPSYRIRVVDRTGVAAFSFRGKNQDQFEALQGQDPQPGQFLSITGGMVSNWNPPDDPTKTIQSIVATRVSEWKLQKDFDASAYFPNVGGEPLNDRQPCILHGFVMQAKPLETKVCECGSNINKNTMECYQQKHPVNMDTAATKPLTSFTVTDGNGFYELLVEGDHTTAESKEFMAVGTWNSDKNTLRPMWWTVKQGGVNVSVNQAKVESAKQDLLRSLKPFKTLPRNTVLNRLTNALDGNEAEAKKTLSDMVDSGVVSDDGINVKYTAD